jgi:hypothetical protein
MFRPFHFKSTFRFRSETRDGQTDQERIDSIANAIQAALQAAETERMALGLRVEEARLQASILAGTDNYEHDGREPETEARLKDRENHLRRGETRMAELDRHIARMNHIRAVVLGDIVPPVEDQHGSKSALQL